MHQIGSHLDEIKNLQTQHNMLVRTNAAARIRLSVRLRLILTTQPSSIVMQHVTAPLSAKPETDPGREH